MSEFKGDFLGFTYNGVHSSDLGIVRTSDGSRFNENLLPTIQDKTVQVPGGDGTYYFGSYYTQRQFSIPFAFDDLTDTQVRQLRARFGDKKIHDLIFDEAPYKTYRAKVTGSAQIKHVVFDEGPGEERVYKGEGTIQFTCYDPYAICTKKSLSEYSDENKNEWELSSGLKENLANYDTFSKNNQRFRLYNPGDISAHFQLKLYFGDYIGEKIPAGKMYLQQDGVTIGTITWREMTKQGPSDECVVFNSKINIIEGAHGDPAIRTGTVYNQFIEEGEFFVIPQDTSEKLFLYLDGDEEAIFDRAVINYNYYYI